MEKRFLYVVYYFDESSCEKDFTVVVAKDADEARREAVAERASLFDVTTEEAWSDMSDVQMYVYDGIGNYNVTLTEHREEN